MAWLKEAGWHIKAVRQSLKVSKIHGEFSANIVLNPPDKRKVDLDGRIKALLDLAQAHELIENDHLCRFLVVSYGPDEGEAGANLTLKPWLNHI